MKNKDFYTTSWLYFEVKIRFKETRLFTKTKVFVSRGKPRSKDDKYVIYGIPTDPIYAFYVDKVGGDAGKIRPEITLSFLKFPSKGELEERMEKVKDTLRCPYCDEELEKWQVPENSFSQTWDNKYMYICFNHNYPYYVRGWDRMYQKRRYNILSKPFLHPHSHTWFLSWRDTGCGFK